ncbi:MAG: ABC transporter permease [Anaerolineae bacterium]|nr:ABC transporter permease [Anaerolineae bacterium]
MSSYSSATRAAPATRQSNPTRFTIIILFAVALVSLLFAEQIAAGWIALGDRINISRRDFNLTEIIAIIGTVLWGLFALWTAFSLARHRDQSIRDYFENNTPMPPALTFATVSIGLIGAICLLIAAQVLTGWVPLGARTNIPRSDLNFVEWATIILGIIWGGLCLRTALGFSRRESPAWSWGQWALFIMIVAGLIIFMSGVFDLPTLAPARSGLSISDNLSGVLLILMPGLLLILSALAAYRILAAEYGAPAPQKAISGDLVQRARARDIAGKRSPAGQAIRNRLAKSPGAGAIIGFVAIFTLFSIATDLFLEPTSLASALSNNVTRGLVAIGTTMLMISGEFDLSVGSLLGVGGLMFMGLVTGVFPPGIPPVHPVFAAIITIAFVCFLGFVNGFLLVKTQIPSFIVTLSTLLMYRGIPLVFIAGGRTLRYVDYFNEPPYTDISRVLIIVVVAGLLIGLGLISRTILLDRIRQFRETLSSYATSDNDFRTLGLIFNFIVLAINAFIVATIVILLVGSLLDQLNQLAQGSAYLTISFFDLMNGRIGSLPIIGDVPQNINLRMGVFWWFIAVIIFQFVLNQTRYGNATFAVGGNAGAARAQGINVNRVKITNYILLAFLVAIASIFDASRLQSIDALRGQGLELEVIAATVIGGALLSGGYGSMIGALLGVFIFGMMQTGLVLIGIDARLFDAIIGLIILVAVIINNWSRRIKS